MAAPQHVTPPEPDGSRYAFRQRLGLVGGFVFFLILLVVPTPSGLSVEGWRAGAVGILMAVWWMTEALPISATSLLPLVLFPLLDILPIEEAASPYANPLIFLFMGGFMIALGMERWDLHRRIALRTIALIGTRPVRIIAGFMAAAAFLSMWVSNTATAMMMLPIGLSVVELVQRSDAAHKPKNFAIALMLAIAYACSMGGLATLIGTPTNALLAGFMAESYNYDIAFVNWTLMALPLTMVGLVVIYVTLTRWVYPIQIQTIPGGKEFIERELRSLGPLSKPEKMVGVVFTLTAILWMTRPLLQSWIPGLSDAGIAIFGALILFILPVDLKRGEFVLNWAWAKRLPWGVLLLFGGGLSLASAIQQTGLAEWIGHGLSGLIDWPALLILLLVVTMIVLLTELTSNTATAAAFLPVLASTAVGIGQNPLLLMVPATMAASCAFMLPVATPPNAIVYGSDHVTIPQMARAGVWLNLAFVLIVTAAAYTLLPLVWDVEIGTLPAWIPSS